ncbi:MAG: zinc-ribbon domain-containing protein [Candidatus Bathyarchaeia archaeon]
MSKFCTKCGHELQTDNEFCPKCGTPVGGVAVAQAPAQETAR